MDYFNSFLRETRKILDITRILLDVSVHVNVILNFKLRMYEMYIPLRPTPKRDTLLCWSFYKLGNWQKVADQTAWCTEGNSAEFTSSRNLILFYLSRSLADRWGTTADFTTSFLHSSRFSVFRSMMFHSRPVHSWSQESVRINGSGCNPSINSLLTVNGKSRLWEGLFSKYFVNVHPFETDTLRRWHFCRLVVWQKVCWPNFLIQRKVTQIHLLRQESVKSCYTDPVTPEA